MENILSKVLIVDDDPGVLDTLEGVFKANGVVVLRAQGAKEALKILNKSHFDAIVCDLMMPEMNGIELMKKVNGEFPFILLTEDGELPFLSEDNLDLVQAFLEKGRIKKDLLKATIKSLSRWERPKVFAA